MKKILGLCLCALVGACCFASQVSAMIIITEILADPPPSIIGDADGNGTRSSSGDEFVEIFNDGLAAINLNGWRLTDAISTRHVFTETIGVREYLAVFGSTASTGALGLNNSSDIISLFDDHDNLIDQVSFGSLANNNQSIVREEAVFVLHSSVSPDLYSPGRNHSTAAVPEPLTGVLFSLGVLGLSRLNIRQNV